MWVYTGDFERIDHLSPLRLHADNQHEALGASMRRAAKTSRSHQARFLREWRVPWPVWMADKKWWSSVTFCQYSGMDGCDGGVEVRRAGARDRYKDNRLIRPRDNSLPSRRCFGRIDSLLTPESPPPSDSGVAQNTVITAVRSSAGRE